jgi:hypothetical protein
VSQAAQEQQAAISSLKGEHAQTIERVKSEAEVETTTVCAMYEEQLAACPACWQNLTPSRHAPLVLVAVCETIQ